MSSKRAQPAWVIRKDTEVTIINPTFVWRVGYPKWLPDYIEQVTLDHSAYVDLLLRRALVKSVDLPAVGQVDVHTSDTVARKQVLAALARAVGNVDGWGGKHRTLHTIVLPQFLGTSHRVCSVKSAVTGVYDPGWCDEEDGGGYGPDLKQRKVHRLALLSGGMWTEDPVLDTRGVPVDTYQNTLYIEVGNLVPTSVYLLGQKLAELPSPEAPAVL